MSQFRKAKPLRTICEVHREMYDIIDDDFKQSPHQQALLDKIKTAYSMGKRMDAKLRQYSGGYDRGWWDRIPPEIVEERLKSRAKR